MEEEGSETEAFWIYGLRKRVQLRVFRKAHTMKRYNNIIQEKSYTFALGILRLIKELRVNGTERVLITQLAKSSTSIGANL